MLGPYSTCSNPTTYKLDNGSFVSLILPAVSFVCVLSVCWVVFCFILFCFGVACLFVCLFSPQFQSLPLFPLFSPVIEPFEPFVGNHQISDFQQSIPHVYVAPSSTRFSSAEWKLSSLKRLLTGEKGWGHDFGFLF